LKIFKSLSLKVRIMIILVVCFLFLFLVLLMVNLYVIGSTKDDILSFAEVKKGQADCIIVLGAGVSIDTGYPSYMLRDRLDKGVELYKAGAAPKMLMSGDHGRDYYDEVNAMKQYAIELGVPSEDIFMDHAGFSTYESMYRAKKIFDVKSAIVVTHKYHLYRALYNAEAFGVSAKGVEADTVIYGAQMYHNLRESLSRLKDFSYTILKPKPKYLGDKIPINGNGNRTNDYKDIE